MFLTKLFNLGRDVFLDKFFLLLLKLFKDINKVKTHHIFTDSFLMLLSYEKRLLKPWRTQLLCIKESSLAFLTIMT